MDSGRTLGITAANLRSENVSLVSDINLTEFSTIVFQPWAVLKGKDSIPAEKVTSIGRRLLELGEWVKAGNDLIVVLSRVQPAKYRKGNQPGNPAQSLDILTAPLFAETKFVPVSGTKIEVVGPAPVGEFFEKFIGRLKYEYLIKNASITPILRVSGAGKTSDQQIVAGYFKLGDGLVVLVPPVDADPTSSAQADYLDVLPELLSYFKGQLRRDLPDWIDRWQTASEQSTREKIREAEEQIIGLRAEVDRHESEIAANRWLLDLFAETGDVFTTAVKKAFIELGINTVEGPHPRADLLLRLDERIGAVEVKGLEGCAKEGNFRQAERWIAEVNHTMAASPEERARDADLRRYAAQLEVLGVDLNDSIEIGTKGFMVIGTFRKTPLDRRSDPSFPDPLARHINRSNVCALTGLQLFCMVLDARRDPNLKHKLADVLFTTSGVYSGRADSVCWRDHLTEVSA